MYFLITVAGFVLILLVPGVVLAIVFGTRAARRRRTQPPAPD